MATIHKALSEIRELKHEEVDLVGGAFSAEDTTGLTESAHMYCTDHGCYAVSTPDDSQLDVSLD